MAKLNAVLYTRNGCHLCEEAEAVLRAYGFEVERVDIDVNPQFKERYDCCVRP